MLWSAWNSFDKNEYDDTWDPILCYEFFITGGVWSRGSFNTASGVSFGPRSPI